MVVAEEIKGGQTLLVRVGAEGTIKDGFDVFDLLNGDFDLEVALYCAQTIQVNGELESQGKEEAWDVPSGVA